MGQSSWAAACCSVAVRAGEVLAGSGLELARRREAGRRTGWREEEEEEEDEGRGRSAAERSAGASVWRKLMVRVSVWLVQSEARGGPRGRSPR